MKSKIRFFFIVISILAVTLSGVAQALVSYSVLKKQLKAVLKSEAVILSELDLSGLSKERIGKSRVTEIGADGTVLYDSVADASLMENHADRDEVKTALREGEGYAVRRSATVHQDTIYYAVRTREGAVLRLASDMDSLYSVLIDTLPVSFIIGVILIFLSVYLSSYLSELIVKPVEEYVEREGSSPPYPELSPFAILMREKNAKISESAVELAARAAQITEIINGMCEGLILLDSDRKILMVNSAALALFESSGETLTGRDLLYLTRNKKLVKIVKQVFESSKTQFETLKIRGRYIKISATNTPYGAICLTNDVTAERQAEELRRSFTENVTHELKTPLTSIRGYSELLSQGVVTSEESKKYGEIILRKSLELLDMITDILALYEIEMGAREEQTEFSLREVVLDIFESLKPKADSRGITMSIAGDLRLKADKRLVTRLLMNLCDNAVRYNIEGGEVKVLIEMHSLSVADTGIGIREEYLGRIFERFYRVDKARSRESGGTGLGLSIVKHAAEKLGAEIKADSVEGEGSVFSVKFNLDGVE